MRSDQTRGVATKRYSGTCGDSVRIRLSGATPRLSAIWSDRFSTRRSPPSESQHRSSPNPPATTGSCRRPRWHEKGAAPVMGPGPRSKPAFVRAWRSREGASIRWNPSARSTLSPDFRDGAWLDCLGGVPPDSSNRHNRDACQAIEFLKNSSPMGQKHLASDRIGGQNHSVKMHCLRTPSWLGKVLRPAGSVTVRMAQPRRRRCWLRTTGKL